MANYLAPQDENSRMRRIERADVDPRDIDSSSDSEEQRTGTLLSEYVKTVSRHRILIALSALCGLTLFLLFGIASQPIFRTRTSLEIQALNNDFMNMRSVAPTGDSTPGGADTNIQTQIKLLQSDTLLRRTMERLESEPHPPTIERADLVSGTARLLRLPSANPIAYESLVEDASKRVKVKPLGVTRLVEVTCDSWNPDLSAKFCNTLTREFQQQDLENRTFETHKTSTWLTDQVADLRQKTEESEHRLEAATGGNGLILSQQSTSVGEDRLRQLQGELVKAQADRMQKEAESGIAREAAPDTLPNVLDNPSHRAYETKLALLRGRLAELVPPLTEENPKVIHVRSEIREAEVGLAASTNISTGRQSNEYAAAKHRESLLAGEYRSQEANVSSTLQKAAQVGLLRREVESEQQLYQTLLQRAKEAGFASALQASTVRVVDAARKPAIPFSPRRGLSAGTGLVLGSLFGIGFAFYKDRTTRVFRVPGDVPRYLHLQELGVIPAASQPKTLAGIAGQHSLSLGPLGLKAPTPSGKALAIARWDDNFSIVAEAYRNATFSILLSDSSKRARTYVVSSPSAGEGKTTVTTNLGVALSKSKLRVVLIDGDLRRPTLHHSFEVENNFGLRNILRGEVALETASVDTYALKTSLPNLSVIPSGKGEEDVVELLHSSFVGGLLARLSRDFDVILIDTPPMLHMADARIFASQSDGVIVVFRAGTTSREQAAAARDLFERDGVRLIGTILNDFDPASEGRSSYYESYYHYQQASSDHKNTLVSR